MELRTEYRGRDDPFEGDCMLWLRSLPAGALVTRATVTVKPARSPASFQETFTFSTSDITSEELFHKDWGVFKNPGTGENTTFIEVDFHARRTLARVTGTQNGDVAIPPGITLQVDAGGIFVGVASDGTFIAPDNLPWVVSLSEDIPATLPGLTVNRFKLSGVSQSATLDVTKVTIRSAPTNISVRLNQTPPFWTRLGELTTPETSPDFAAVLNDFLRDAAVENGFYVIPFIVHSDTIARLNVALQIDYIIEQAVLPPNLPEANMSYGFSTLPSIDSSVMTAALPRGAIPVAGQTDVDIRGEFQPTRIASGDIGADAETIPVRVSPDLTLAQPIQFDQEIAVTAIDLPLANTNPGLTGLNVSIQADIGGRPFGDILTSAEVIVEKPLPGQSSWGSAALPAPFRVEKGISYWLILQSQVGEAYWTTMPGAVESSILHSSRDGGLSWRPATILDSPSATAALFRLRDTPDRFTVPVQLQIGEGPGAVRRQLNEFLALGRVEFSFDFAEKLAEHLADASLASPCGTDELLTNGDFEQPPHTDATRRIFGFDTAVAQGSEALIQGTNDLSRGVNLSIERFITLVTSLGDEGGESGVISVAGFASETLEPALEDLFAINQIDCAGNTPARTTGEDIEAAINQAVSRGVNLLDPVASYNTQNGAISLDGSSNFLLLLPWIRPTTPLGWQGTAGVQGKIWRVKLPTKAQGSTATVSTSEITHHEILTVALEALGTESTVLTQRVNVAPDCTYTLHLIFSFLNWRQPLLTNALQQSIPSAAASISIPNTPDPAAEPFWEVIWLDAEDQRISNEQETLDVFHFKVGSLEMVPQSLTEFEAQFVAPTGAVQAEIRFVQPPPGILILDRISFTPTLKALRNSNFRVWSTPTQVEAAAPLGWTIVSGWVEQDRDPVSEQLRGGALLRGSGAEGAPLPENAILSQTAVVAGGEDYQLVVRAYAKTPSVATPPPVQQRARLELQWLSDGSPPNSTVTLPLDGRDFLERAWNGTAPMQATQAEIRLIQPQGRGDLVVESVSLARTDRVDVPLIFLAEAPGELTVSNLQVAYDLPNASEPPQPPLLPESPAESQSVNQAAPILPAEPSVVSKPQADQPMDTPTLEPADSEDIGPAIAPSEPDNSDMPSEEIALEARPAASASLSEDIGSAIAPTSGPPPEQSFIYISEPSIDNAPAAIPEEMPPDHPSQQPTDSAPEVTTDPEVAPDDPFSNPVTIFPPNLSVDAPASDSQPFWPHLPIQEPVEDFSEPSIRQQPEFPETPMAEEIPAAEDIDSEPLTSQRPEFPETPTMEEMPPTSSVDSESVTSQHPGFSETPTIAEIPAADDVGSDDDIDSGPLTGQQPEFSETPTVEEMPPANDNDVNSEPLASQQPHFPEILATEEALPTSVADREHGGRDFDGRSLAGFWFNRSLRRVRRHRRRSRSRGRCRLIYKIRQFLLRLANRLFSVMKLLVKKRKILHTRKFFR